MKEVAMVRKQPIQSASKQVIAIFLSVLNLSVYLSTAFHPSGSLANPSICASNYMGWDRQSHFRRGVEHGNMASKQATQTKDSQEEMLDDLPQAVQCALEAHVHLPVGSPVLVSVSGGSDSVALLRIIVLLNSRKRQWSLSAVHFNHGLRPEADAEEDFVKALCAEHGVPLYVRHLASHDASMILHGSEADWRAWRRSKSVDILKELCAAHALHMSGEQAGSTDERDMCGAIMIAHHADDQIETVLMKCLRGCHLSNLHGMRWQDGYFVRPLLGQRKEELKAYLRVISQPWMEDPSNAEPKYKRNKIRLQLVPLLEELAGGSLHARAAAVEQQSEQLRQWLLQESAAYLEAEPAWQRESVTGQIGPRGLNISRLQQQVPMLQDELLQILLSQAEEAGPMPYTYVRLLREQLERPASEWTLDLANSYSVRRVGDLLTALPRVTAGSHSSASGGFAADRPQRVIALGNATVHVSADWRVNAGWLRHAEAPEASVVLHKLFVNASLDVRMPQPGDHFHPTWKEKPIKLASFLRGQHVPLDRRRSLPVVSLSGSQEVLAVLHPPHVARSVAGTDQANVEVVDDNALWITMDS